MSSFRLLPPRPLVTVDRGTAFVRVGTTEQPVVAERAVPDEGRSIAIRGGVIQDLDAAAACLGRALRDAEVNRTRRVHLVVSVPATATSVERRAIQWVAEIVGIRAPVTLVDEPLAAAIGLGLEIADEQPHFVIDVGHGVTEAAIIAAGEIIEVRGCRVGCADLADPCRADTALQRIGRCARLVLDDAHPDISVAVDRFHLVGGGSLRPEVRRQLAGCLQLPLLVGDDPLHAVARGDALCAASTRAERR